MFLNRLVNLPKFSNSGYICENLFEQVTQKTTRGMMTENVVLMRMAKQSLKGRWGLAVGNSLYVRELY